MHFTLWARFSHCQANWPIATAKVLEQLNRYKERQRQIELAKMRGEEHIGDNAAQIINAKAKKKTKN
jgi:hypothetical protein